MRIGYLGPPGTFTEQAATRIGNSQGDCQGDCLSDCEIVDYPAIEDVFKAVSERTIELAVVPFENSTEGVVNATIDALVFDYKLYIQFELSLPIAQCLMQKANAAEDKPILTIYSHAQSLAQCRNFLRAHYPNAKLIPMASNAKAARFLTQCGDDCAAIGPAQAALLYGLKLTAKDVQDQKNNSTTFIALSDNAEWRLEKGKTTLAFSTRNQPGALSQALNIFSLWDINMTKILSRPMKNKPGEYVFYVDLEEYDAKDLRDAIKMIRRKANFFKYLGSYPKA